jgi:hypothetical protein
MDRYDQQSNIVSDLAGGTVASVVDFGASVWNSLPGTEEVDTADLLSRVSSNALRVYEEHPDAVQAASFIGGIFAPAGLAMKGMNALRAGTKGATWFNDAGKASRLKEMDELFAKGGKATAEYRAARNAHLAKTAANQMVDSFAIEGAIIGAMNAHPFMEDYMKDPVSNFLIWGAVGGVIGGGIGAIGENYLMKQGAGNIAAKAVKTVVDDIRVVPEGLPMVSKLQVRQQNIQNLEALLGHASEVGPRAELNELTKDVAEKILLKEKARQVEDFEKMSSTMIQGLEKADQDLIMQRLIDDPRFAGVDAISLLRIEEKNVSPFQAAKAALADTFDFQAAMNKKTQTAFLKEQVLFTEFNKAGSRAHAAHYARANALGLKEADIGKLGKQYTKVPHTDASLELAFKDTAHVDKLYLDALKHVDELDAKALAKVVVDPDDIPTLQALFARIQKDPEAFEKAKIILTKSEPNYGAIEQAVFKAGGVSADHLTKITKMTSGDDRYNIVASRGLSEDARTMLDDWVGGNPSAKDAFRRAFDAFFREASLSKNKGIAEEIYNSTGSRAFREELRKLADADGNIYLYRGIRGQAKGHSAVESYTPSASVAASFGGKKLYKVHVDDVIGTVRISLREFEVLVGSPARQVEATLPIMNEAGKVASVTKLSTTHKEITPIELSAHLMAKKEEAIRAYVAQGMPMETIAIRTNTPLDAVQAFVLSNADSLMDIEKSWISYNEASKIAEYLSPQLQPLVLKANINKVPYATLSANLDARATMNINQQIIEAFTLGSQSQTAREFGAAVFGEWRYALDILRSEVSNAVNQKAGNKFFTSTDFFVRDMGDFGQIANVVGKKIQHIANQAEKRLIQPLTEHMNKIAPNELSRVEINTALKLNAELTGPRAYKDRQFWQMEEVIRDGKKVQEAVPVRFQGKEFKVVLDDVDALLQELDKSGRELYNLKNTINEILGKPNVNDLGFWVPAFNPTGKHISYVWNKLDDSTQILWGNTAEELATAEKAYGAAFADKIARKEILIVTKSDQELHNKLNGRLDPLTMAIANVERMHTGASSPAIVKANVDIFGEIAGGYQHYINSHVRSLAELSMHDITDILDKMSAVNKHYFENQPLSIVGKLTHKPEDAARVMKNTLIGNSNLTEYTNWKQVNQSFETGMNWAIGKMQAAWKEATKLVKKPDDLSKLDYEKLAKELDAAGIHNPWAVFDQEAANLFKVAKLTEATNVSPRMIYTSNALAATVALRFGELAQPIVNAISLPILTTSAIVNRMPSTFMGVQKGTAKFNPVQVMYEGARASNSQHWKKLDDLWAKEGYYEPFVSEATAVMRQSRSFEPGSLAKVEKALDSNLVQWMSWTADKSESMVRRQAMFTGGVLAKRLYPELDDVGVTIFARDFMDKAIGNYHASQRPVFFQGTLGTAMGLFQTYMLTMGQSMYRHLELKNYKALGKMMLAQSSIFGAGSLPGFSIVSKTIGEHFSDDNVDLTTGTFRALGDKTASLVLYGLPSNLGPAFYSRGEIAPRVPSGLTGLPTVSMVGQTLQSALQLTQALSKDYPDVSRAFGEALSMQSMSRPLARGAELLTGYSVTRQGNTIASPDEVWTTTGIMARILGTRPLEEAKLREAIHLNHYYSALDHDARQKVTEELKIAIRNNELTDSKLSRLAEEYMRTGTPQGWRAALNTAIGQSNVSGKYALMKKLRPDDPLNFMIDQMDGE